MMEEQEPIVINEEEEENFIMNYIFEQFGVAVPANTIRQVIEGQLAYMESIGLIDMEE